MDRRSIFKVSVAALAAAPLFGRKAAAAVEKKQHKLVVHVDQNDPAVMRLALGNSRNAHELYTSWGEDVAIEIVCYSQGLHMLRDDTSPVKDRIKELSEVSFPSNITFSACNNTKQGMEKREGHPVTIIPQAHLVPAGVVRIMELEEQGYSYVRP